MSPMSGERLFWAHQMHRAEFAISSGRGINSAKQQCHVPPTESSPRMALPLSDPIIGWQSVIHPQSHRIDACEQSGLSRPRGAHTRCIPNFNTREGGIHQFLSRLTSYVTQGSGETGFIAVLHYRLQSLGHPRSYVCRTNVSMTIPAQWRSRKRVTGGAQRTLVEALPGLG